MSHDYADYATRAVNEEKPVKAWACCWADESAMSEHEPGHPLEGIDGYLPGQVIPWKDSKQAVGIFNLWGQIGEPQPQSGPIKYDFIEQKPYYVAQYGYPERLWVFDPELAFPLERAFDVSSKNYGAGLSHARDRVWVRSVEWVNLVLRPAHGNPPAAITEDVAARWRPANVLQVRWRGLWPWRSPSIVRRVRWDDDEPLDPRLISYHLQGVADIGQAGQRPVLVYKAFSSPAEKERELREAMKYLPRVR